MHDDIIWSLYRKYKPAKSKPLSSLVQRMQKSVNIRRTRGFDKAAHSHQAWIGGQLFNAGVRELVSERHNCKRVQYLSKLADQLVSRDFKRTVAAVSGLNDVSISDLNWAIDDLDNDGEDVMKIISSVLDVAWEWAQATSRCDKLLNQDLKEPYEEEEGTYLQESKKLICLITDRSGITFTTPGVLHLDVQREERLNAAIYNESIHSQLLKAIVLFIKAGYEWDFPPTKEGKVLSDVEQFKSKAFRGDAQWYRLVIKLIKKRFPKAPRLFVICLFQAVNSNEFMKALGSIKKGALPGGGEGLTVHEKGSYFEFTTAQSIEDNKNNPKAVEKWAENTLKECFSYGEQAYNLITNPPPSRNSLKRSQPPTTTNGRHSRPCPERSIVPDVHPNLQHLAIMRMAENATKAGKSTSGTVVVSQEGERPPQDHGASIIPRVLQDSSNAHRTDHRLPYRSRGNTSWDPTRPGASCREPRPKNRYFNDTSSIKPPPSRDQNSAPPPHHRITDSKAYHSRSNHPSKYSVR